MWKLINTYEEIVITTLAFLFVSLLVGIFFWTVTGMLAYFDKAIAPSTGANANQVFDLNGAKQLDLKGQIVP